MKKFRAIYMGDVRFEACPVFELDETTDKYCMLGEANADDRGEPDFCYDKECIDCDSDWFKFEVNGEEPAEPLCTFEFDDRVVTFLGRGKDEDEEEVE